MIIIIIIIILELTFLPVCVYACVLDSLPASCGVSSSIPSALAALQCTPDHRGAAETREGRGAGEEEEKKRGLKSHEDVVVNMYSVSAELFSLN